MKTNVDSEINFRAGVTEDAAVRSPPRAVAPSAAGNRHEPLAVARDGEGPRNRRKRPAPPSVGVLTTMQPRPAFEVWTREQWFALAWHLHNGNGQFDFILGWFGVNTRNGGRPEPIYVKSKRTLVAKAIPWAWGSLCGKGTKKIAVVFYSQNSAALSRWAGVDFDAHSGDPEEADTARRRAFDFFQASLNLDRIHLILEASGRGWHVWLLSKEFRPCRDWTALLAGKLAECGIPVTECELFPPPATEANPHGKGMRAPGCWSPARQEPSQILWENIGPILAKSARSVPLKEKDDSLPFVSLSLYPRLLPLLDEFAIVKVSTRRKLLQKFCGQLFHQTGFEMAQRFAAEQFARRRTGTKASKTEHLQEFGEFWTGLHRLWLADLTPSERTAFETLTTDSEQDAFRVVRSYARKAHAENRPDFMIVRDDLAARIGITGRGAGLLIQRFCDDDPAILQRIQEYVPHKTAARYRWLLTQSVADVTKSR